MLRICYKHWLSKTSNVLARLVVTAQVYAPWRKIGRMQVLFNKKLSFFVLGDPPPAEQACIYKRWKLGICLPLHNHVSCVRALRWSKELTISTSFLLLHDAMH